MKLFESHIERGLYVDPRIYEISKQSLAYLDYEFRVFPETSRRYIDS